VSLTTVTAVAPPLALAEALRVTVVAPEPMMVRRVEAALAREGVPAVVEQASVDELGLLRSGAQSCVIVWADALRELGDVEEGHLIQRRVPGAHVVTVIGDAQRRSVRWLLNAGADAIVLESELELNLGLAIRSVCAGHLTVPHQLCHGMAVPALSYRQRQILGLVTAGLTNDQIAGRLCLSESTVKGHLTSAFRRLGVDSRREAVAMIVAGEESLRRSVLTASRGGPDDRPLRRPGIPQGVGAWS
jgi:DNA-binding NarL/FixJ family response regulator